MPLESMRLRLLSMRMTLDSLIMEVSSALAAEDVPPEEAEKDKRPKTFGSKKQSTEEHAP
jgi:hypothetical protein